MLKCQLQSHFNGRRTPVTHCNISLPFELTYSLTPYRSLWPYRNGSGRVYLFYISDINSADHSSVLTSCSKVLPSSALCEWNRARGEVARRNLCDLASGQEFETTLLTHCLSLTVSSLTSHPQPNNTIKRSGNWLVTHPKWAVGEMDVSEDWLLSMFVCSCKGMGGVSVILQAVTGSSTQV